MTEVIVLPDPAAVAVAAADRVVAAVRAAPRGVLGVATGSTPLGTYAELGARHAAGEDFSGLDVVLLDEYIGLPVGDPQRYLEVIRRELADRIGLPHSRVHAPDVDATDVDSACAAYERTIAALGGVDLQILGLGADGHVAFNMPGTQPDSRTRRTALSEQTVRDNARFFGDRPDRVPRSVVTQGLGTIREARSLLMLVAGAHKADALEGLLARTGDLEAPGTALLDHPDLVVLADRAAARSAPR